MDVAHKELEEEVTDVIQIALDRMDLLKALLEEDAIRPMSWESYDILPEELSITGEKLGSGSSGSVFGGSFHSTPVAIKTLVGPQSLGEWSGKTKPPQLTICRIS